MGHRILGIFLCLLYSATAMAVTPSGVPQRINGGANGIQGNLITQFNKSAAPDTFTIQCGNQNSTALHYQPCYKNGVAFSVATGHIAYCSSLIAQAAGASITVQLVSATASFASDAAGPLTGGVFEGGAASTFPHTTSTTAGVPTQLGTDYWFDATAAQVFVGIQGGTGIIASMQCYVI